MILPDSISSLYTQFEELSTVDQQNIPPNVLPEIPEDPIKLTNFVDQLYKDAIDWRAGSYINRVGNTNPIAFWQSLFLLESGAHWEVWGRRNVKPKDAWKAELVDDEISNQVRIKTAYLTANWHRIKINPNVQHIDEIIRQEQQKSDWTTIIRDLTKNTTTYGSAIVKSIMDYDTYPQGVATETVLDNASFLPSPFTYGLRAGMGCWYAFHATIQPMWKIQEMHYESMKGSNLTLRDLAKVDSQKAKEIGSTNPKKASGPKEFMHTPATDHLELWLDDFTLVETVYSDGETEVEHEAMTNGDKTPVHHWQNHKKHIDAHLAFLKGMYERAASDEDMAALEPIAVVLKAHVETHMQYNMSGMTRKYPFGRKIVRAGGKIVENIPNPFRFDWHRLFRWVDFEKVKGQIWGRGLVEILIPTNKTLDLMISRMADLGLASVSGPIVNQETAELWKKEGVSNNPNEPRIRADNDAVVYPPMSRSPLEFLQLYKLMKDIGSKSQGISDVTYGQSPTPGASGDLAELLLRQNSIIVTGEANINIGAAVEDIIETRLLMMKQFYTSDRKYFIAGRYQDINVSNALTYIEARDETGQVELDMEGNPIKYELPDLEVTVIPNSNLPNQWETDLTLALKLFSTVGPDGVTPLVSEKAVYDVLGERYPQYGSTGEYHTLNEATKLGMEIIRKRQEEAEAKQKDTADIRKNIRSVARGVTNKRLRARLEAGNGSGSSSLDIPPIGEG